MTPEGNDNVRAKERRALKTQVEFFIDGDIELATSVDVSESGIRFDSTKPVKVRMRLNVDGELKEFLSQLVWARRNPDNSMAYGFEFIPDDDDCVF